MQDRLFYSLALAQFSTQFWSGDFYPRWLTEVNGGAGSPVFLFYGPLAYYFSLIGGNPAWDGHGEYRLLISMALSFFASGVTMYLWMRQKTSRRIATIGALVYVGLPYHMHIMYFKYGLAALWAAALFPLALLAVDWFKEDRKQGLALLTLIWAGMILTHVISAVMLLPVLIAYFFYHRQNRTLRQSVKLVAGLVLGVALAAFYLLPLALNKHFVVYQEFLQLQGGYAGNPYGYLRFYYFFLMFAPLIAAFFLAKPYARRKFLANKEHRFWCVMLVGLLFIASPLSLWFWDRLPLLHYVQSPNRFYWAMLPAVSLLAARLLIASNDRYFAYWIVGGVIVLFNLLAWAVPPAGLFQERVAAVRAITVPEYRTVWTDQAFLTLEQIEAWQKMPLVRVIAGDGDAEIRARESRHMELRVRVKNAPMTVRLKRFYFPEWKLSSSPDTTPVLTPEPESGLMLLTFPTAGEFSLRMTHYFQGERLGNGISLAAALVWIILFFHYCKGFGFRHRLIIE